MGSDHSKKQSSVDDFLLPLKQSGVIDPQTYQTGKLIVKHLQNRQSQQLKEYFLKRQAKLDHAQVNPSVCLRSAKKEETVFECKTCQYMEGNHYCGDCFQEEAHANHDYRAVEGKKTACMCGNDQILDQNFFCKKHAKVIVILTLEDSYLKKEIKFFLQLLLFLKKDYNTCKTLKFSPESIVNFGVPLLQYLLELAKSAPRSSKVVVAEALLEKMDILVSEELKLQPSGSSLLEELILAFSESELAAKLLELINLVFWAATIRKELLRIYYRTLLLGDVCNTIPNIFDKINYAFSQCYNNQLEYFSNLSNARVFLNRGISADQLQKQYSTFYASIAKLLKFKNSKKIITNILSETAFSKFFNYQFEGAKYVEPINKLTIPAFYLARRMIRIVEEKDVLRAIAFNALSAIERKNAPPFDLIFQRSFALAVYQFFDFTIPDASELRSFFKEIKLDPQELILRFWEARESNQQAYNQQIIKNEKGDSCPSQFILATDQLYVRILCSLIASKEEVSALYNRFIERILRVPNSFQRVQQIKETITNVRVLKGRLHQLGSFISLLGSSLSSSLAELVVRGCQSTDRESIERVLTYLSMVFDGCNAAEFKTNAQRLVDEKEVVAFIKDRLILEGKKIRSKGETKSNVRLFPFSEYFPVGLSEIALERMMSMGWQQESDHKNVFIEDECLRHLLILLYACLIYLEEDHASESQVQKEIEALLRSILAFSGEKRSKEFLSLIQRIHKKLANCPITLDSITKRVIQFEKAEVVGQGERGSKKRQKLLEMKAKQKNVLQALGVAEEERGAECIVCKNSKAGNPYLLGHFGYKNVFLRMVEAETPFLEFSSCGHYIHQQCLQDSHKNEFKIWYPCILCKAICNILLPSVTSRSGDGEEGNELFARVLTFLKNLGGIYTFFYQDRKELLEFSIENVEGVFPLLFKTLVYQITFYPILNLQYFQRSQLPVTRFLFDLLEFTSDRLKGVTVVRKLPVKGDPFFVGLFNFVAEEVAAALKHQGQRGAGGDLPSDIVVMVEEIIYMLSKRDLKMEIAPRATKDYRQRVVSIFQRPPQDLRELQCQVRSCASCQKPVQNYELCLLCEWVCCAKCGEVKKVHALQSHLSQSVFLRSANGKYTYVHEELLGEFSSLYVDYLGEEYGRTERAAVGEYLLSREKWEGVVEDLLNNRLHREIMKFQ